MISKFEDIRKKTFFFTTSSKIMIYHISSILDKTSRNIRKYGFLKTPNMVLFGRPDRGFSALGIRPLIESDSLAGTSLKYRGV